MNEISWPKIDSSHLIVYSKQMLEIENQIFSNGMPLESLMEKVGIRLTNWLLNNNKLLTNGIIVVIGPGNNGGDGTIVARELFLKGFKVRVWCPFPIKKKFVNQHLNYITSLGVEKLIKTPDPRKNDLWIDSILGNNQNRSIDKTIIDLFNYKFERKNGNIVSIDVPTGLCPNTGKLFSESCIKANYTLPIGLKKIGLLQDEALPYVGKIHNIDIDLSENQLLKVKDKILGISYEDIQNLKFTLPIKNSNKYKRGRTLLITGCEKYLGAASIVMKGALASGVGSVKALLPREIAKSIWHIAPEVVVSGCLDKSPDDNALIFNSLQKIELNNFDTILVGPGIGIDLNDWDKCVSVFIDFKGLLILDADALNRISNSNLGSRFFLKRKGKTWITPHFAEFKRLFPHLKGNNNVELASNAARKFQISVLLKGANSQIADKEGLVWQIYETDPNSAMAGFGDLLSGFIAGMSAFEMATNNDINTESLAKYALLHSYAASKCIEGSNAMNIERELSKITKQIKMR